MIRSSFALRARSKGAALLLAMLTVTLVSTLAASALWQQWRGIEVETAERSRLQASWVLVGALDWARLILLEDARTSAVDHLGEPWAIPLQESRLSSFLAADKSTTADPGDTLPQAFLSGVITDQQARLNVFNLVDGGKLSEPAMRAFGKLFELLGLAPTELNTMANNLRFALVATASGATSKGPNVSANANTNTNTDTNAASDDMGNLAPLLPQRVEQLVWLGLSPSSLQILRPYITLLPVRTPVNINTASAPVLYASIPGLDMAQAQRLVTARQSSPFLLLTDATKVLGLARELDTGEQSVGTHFFEVQGRFRLDQAVTQERSFVQREGLVVKVLWRDHDTPSP
jgi:general secretion pathway protein K